MIKTILATDCGSTTTKAILIERIDGEYRFSHRGEAPTTVEAPFEDVTKGVLNAVMEIEEISNRKILDEEKIITPQNGKEGVDIYISTSSAGGGLQMMVAGVVKSMTGESAERAALGAGSIVMDVLASNDGRKPHEKITRIRQLRPDMILLSGGIDGGTTKHVVELAEILAAANPQPRLGQDYKLPVIYAGNKKAASDIKNTLGNLTDLDITENIRPILEKENLDLIVGSGGVLSHAPRREQSAKMLIDSFLPEGITSLAVDSIFMMPQLGAMANIDIKELAEEARIAALEVFEKDCLIRLGTCIAPTCLSRCFHYNGPCDRNI